MNLIAEIIPDKKTSVLKETYTYLVPKEFEDDIKIGSIVKIPFGKDKIRGIVWKISEEDEKDKKPYKLKSIAEIDTNFKIPEKYLSVMEWISEYYLCSIGEAASLFMPLELKNPRKPNASAKIDNIKEKKLTNEQAKVYEKIITLSNKKPVLLLGVTGSGKTEIYIKLISKALSEEKKVIFLVPEIMLATQTIDKLNQHFREKISLYHSNLSKSERYLAYQSFVSGERPIILGPRSALSVPAENIGLIVIDEEHDDAYKQESNPRYHTVELAKKIAEISEAKLILGSATPRIEDFYRTKLGQFELVKLTNRYNQLSLPPSRIIDLKNEMSGGNYSTISNFLQENIQRILDSERQVLLLLNRLGMATFVSCRDCGEVINCPNCEIPLVYHLDSSYGYLSCHHCNHKQPNPDICPNCGGLKIKYFGTGIDKVERDLAKLFPKARIRKVNSKIMENKDSYVNFYNEVADKKIDIILGTQIVAKGLDLPAIDLVGVISADTGLHLPQYSASEKVFQLLTQVSGRSGRKHSTGLSIIQSYWPESFPIQMAGQHDYEGYYQLEILERKKHNYPPFCHLIRVISENTNKEKALSEIKKTEKKLKDEKINFIGPGLCFFSKLHNRYRYHIVIKTDELPDPRLTKIFKENQYLTWDIDPTNLL